MSKLQTMGFEKERRTVEVFDEPLLEFAYRQRMQDPHDGLSLFGPFDLFSSSKPKTITWGLIATSAGAKKFRQWVAKLQEPIYPGTNKRGGDLNPRLWPVYPGFEAAYGCSFPATPAWEYELDEQRLIDICSNLDSKKRAFDAVEEYLSGIELTQKRDENFGVLVCVVPDLIRRNCRPNAVVSEGTGVRISKKEQSARAHGQTGMFEPYDPDIYNYSEDFRRQIKARCMGYGIPIQIVKESTITPPSPGEKQTTSPPSDLAWNLSTTMYYKAGGKPWKLANARPGVCYIGMAFRRTDPTSWGRTACCAAQMFLDSGDGVVFLGESGLWYSPQSHEFHLSREAARRLLSGVLKLYEELDGQPLTEIFLHSRSGVSAEEFSGYREACPHGVHLVAVKVRKDFGGFSLFREQQYPVLRGTFWAASPRHGYLFASGVVPRLATYPGAEAPVPLRIDLQHGQADLNQVAQDIFALTKLNYNACRLGSSEPITIGFSDAVGEILVSNPTVKKRSPKFKFYI